MAVEIGFWSAAAVAVTGGGEIDWMGAEIGARTVNAANITAGCGEKGSEMIFAARAVLDPGRHVRQLRCFPAWLLVVVVAFATYDRQEEVEHGVWEERGREFDLPGDL
jgi:hypothetical protein